MPKLADVVSELREKRGLSQAALARKLGLSSVTVNLREQGKSDIPGKGLLQLAEATGSTIAATPVGWQVLDVPGAAPRELPFFGAIPCGRPLPVGEEAVQSLDLGDLSRGDWDWRNGFVIQAAGDSMDPVIADGDWLICRRQDEWRLWDIVVVFVDDETTVKQVRPHPDPRRGQCLAPVNESHGRMLDVEGADVRMYGLVLGRLFYQPLGR